MSDLEGLSIEISQLGESIKTLKSSNADAAVIKEKVDLLLAAKRSYAEKNNGIGVDGKPFVEKMTKSQKKAAAAAQKAQGDGETQGAGPTKPQADPNSVNAQKKAAKKAEKAAKKAAAKAEASPAPSVAKPKGTPPKQENNKPETATKAAPAIPVAATQAFLAKVSSNLIVWNPNDKVSNLPLVAFTVAVLSNTILDYSLGAHHKAPTVAMGLPNGGTVQGDLAVARFMARKTETPLYPSKDAAATANIDMWIDYSVSLTRLEPARQFQAAVLTVEKALQAGRTFVTGHTMTLADLVLFQIVGFPTSQVILEDLLAKTPAAAVDFRRWCRTLAVHPALQEATQLCASTEVTDFVGAPVVEPLVSGMCPLEGAVPGRVVTRFPPEPSGYLHIGHAKAVLLNDYYATRYKGRLILRFDDTNPSKEKEEYQESFVVDLALLGVSPDVVSYSSDYFDVCLGYAKKMMAVGLAYMDDTPPDQMKTERENRQASKHRETQTPAEALEKFELMCSGDPAGAPWCMRAKIDMKSNNGTLRDPVLYRQNLTPHHRTGSTFKAYPTYDFCCPIVDSIEGVTHALRATEYDDRNAQFQWMASALGLRRPRNHNFSKVNFEYTVLSKRKLTWFVEQGHVTGWDDARFPTVRGVVRRGIDIAALRSFIYAQGASRNVVNMVWHAFWANNKNEIDGKAKRFMAIDSENSVTLTINNGPSVDSNSYKETALHPKDISMGTRTIRIAKTVLLEAVDVDGLAVGDEIVLLRWGVVRITNVEGNCLQGDHVPNGDFKKARKLSWLANVAENTPVVLYEFDYLITKPKIEKDENFQDFVNPMTMATTKVVGDPGLRTLQEHDIIQLERRGYYRVDRPYLRSPDRPLELFMIPDGKAKAMGGTGGKLAHH